MFIWFLTTRVACYLFICCLFMSRPPWLLIIYLRSCWFDLSIWAWFANLALMMIPLVPGCFRFWMLEVRLMLLLLLFSLLWPRLPSSKEVLWFYWPSGSMVFLWFRCMFFCSRSALSIEPLARVSRPERSPCDETVGIPPKLFCSLGMAPMLLLWSRTLMFFLICCWLIECVFCKLWW